MWTAHGCTLDPVEWATCIGTRGGFDPYATLVQRSSVAVAPEDEVREAKRVRETALLEHSVALPGVIDWVDEATALGLAVGIASSSSSAWLEHHLGRLGLRHRFATVSCCDGQCSPKPAPDLYLAACNGLGVGPEEAVAVEDSPHGIAAAKAAGLRCVAVPGDLTRDLDLGAADLVLTSLADLSLADALRHAPL